LNSPIEVSHRPTHNQEKIFGRSNHIGKLRGFCLRMAKSI
jgi:hypothetical protein